MTTPLAGPVGDGPPTASPAVPGRDAFQLAVQTESRRCARGLEPLSVLLVDVQGLENAADAPALARGVEAIATAMERSGQRAGDVLAHLGGRGLGLVLPGVAEEGALAVALRLVDVVAALRLPEAPALRAKVGCATSSHLDVSLEPTVLLARAHEALRTATASSSLRACAYDESLTERARLQQELADALTRGELQLTYQPTVDLSSGTVTGFEALMRWDRPGHGQLAPRTILEIAEGSTLALDLGRWALGEAVGRLAEWTLDGLDPRGELRVEVNVSERHAASPAILDDVRDALRGSGVSPNQLELDVTESVRVDTGPAAANLRTLRATGVRVAIDDFGTGATSVLQLPRLEVDVLKIDQSLIASADPGVQALVGVILDAGRAFRLAVVAEGVEDDSTLLTLRAAGCDGAQGFVFARPMAAEAVAPWLTGWRSEIAAGRWRRAEDVSGRQTTWT